MLFRSIPPVQEGGGENEMLSGTNKGFGSLDIHEPGVKREAGESEIGVGFSEQEKKRFLSNGRTWQKMGEVTTTEGSSRDS